MTRKPEEVYHWTLVLDLIHIRKMLWRFRTMTNFPHQYTIAYFFKAQTFVIFYLPDQPINGRISHVIISL